MYAGRLGGLVLLGFTQSRGRQFAARRKRDFLLTLDGTRELWMYNECERRRMAGHWTGGQLCSFKVLRQAL